jgi:hypothetical protein
MGSAEPTSIPDNALTGPAAACHNGWLPKGPKGARALHLNK